jgi:hypothetical protein
VKRTPCIRLLLFRPNIHSGHATLKLPFWMHVESWGLHSLPSRRLDEVLWRVACAILLRLWTRICGERCRAFWAKHGRPILSRGEHVVAIPGTAAIDHMKENIARQDWAPTPDVLVQIDGLISQATVSGARYPPGIQATIDTEEFA